MNSPAEQRPANDDLEAIARSVAQAAAEHVRSRRPELFGSSADPAADTIPAVSTKSTVPTVPTVSTKSTETDPVTVADTETEHLIRSLLRTARPDDEVLGEEAGGSVDVPSGVRWVVDPIDGTVNFMYGVPAYAVSVAAQIDGQSVAGAVVDVARGLTYSAARGGGAYLHGADGTRIRLSCNEIDRADLALVATGFGYEATRRRIQGEIVAGLLPRVRDIRRIGAAALDLCMVASGAVDAHYEHGLSPWDWAAGALIAAEAGAVVHIPPPDSRSSEGYLTLATAPGIATELVSILDELGARDRVA
ncbi:inositol monophosphatase [Gordonia bronchialis DSM 43247]|uniref:Inositol-1-monophosphatase n=1 Tax=Gordonia bronchialis (strain ATCC 25592 / DSM 43247 / BCRC 13721 / JCM 3198 / KCTC 3076 / NBRC 16047 / NCTC 10667) TaxID=526226 RepID=D0LBT1_GORB4|nr:inositol monophosphatase family protein [Gordonia bronchialis]ACY21495.1 inositol monophosphatase [Gordonia bronchialis DSM 43247]MCC3324277.1 inositol monophosphatase [Gordonia bronchialis]QGS24859.1 inositol monophosphatase [Gordonia bronchialis]UAK38886.1 inositol monophosphatase [Gordonia bronchialis]